MKNKLVLMLCIGSLASYGSYYDGDETRRVQESSMNEGERAVPKSNSNFTNNPMNTQTRGAITDSQDMTNLEKRNWQNSKEQFTLTQVKDVQRALRDKGFNVGAIDGQVGPKTRNAIMQYQASNNLDESGKLNRQLMNSLDIEDQSSYTEYSE